MEFIKEDSEDTSDEETCREKDEETEEQRGDHPSLFINDCLMKITGSISNNHICFKPLNIMNTMFF